MEVNKVNIRLVALSYVYNSFQDFISITSILQLTSIWSMNKKYYVLIMCHLLMQVICAKCSEFKPLADNSRHNRVCKECFLQLPASPCSPGVETVGEQKKRQAAEVWYLLRNFWCASCPCKSITITTVNNIIII